MQSNYKPNAFKRLLSGVDEFVVLCERNYNRKINLTIDAQSLPAILNASYCKLLLIKFCELFVVGSQTIMFCLCFIN